jgi:hypothetical protein
MATHRCIVLCTSTAGGQSASKGQDKICNRLEAKKVKYVTVDGVEDVEKRRELFGISKVTQYPQVFLEPLDNSAPAEYLGSTEEFIDLLETDDIPEEIFAQNPELREKTFSARFAGVEKTA